MIIRNKKIIGLISLLTGLILLGYIAFTTSVVFYGNKTNAVVTGFLFQRNGAHKVENENNSYKKPFKGRSPFVKFTTKDGHQVEAYSKVIQLFSITGYTIGDAISVVYNPSNPQHVFILNIKELPGLLLIVAFAILLVLMGKSLLFSKPIV